MSSGKGGRKLGTVKFVLVRDQIGWPPGSQVSPDCVVAVVFNETSLCFYFTSPTKQSWPHNSAYSWETPIP